MNLDKILAVERRILHASAIFSLWFAGFLAFAAMKNGYILHAAMLFAAAVWLYFFGRTVEEVIYGGNA